MQNINEVKDQLNRMLNNVEDISRQISEVSENISNIEEGRNIKIQLINILEQTYPISARMRELINIDNSYVNIVETFIDENDITYEVSLFDEITTTLEYIETEYTRRVESIDRKINELEIIGDARIIPEDEAELRIFNEQIINQSTCPICTVRVVNTRIDCGHLYCVNCVINLTECPLCRTQIKDVSKIYLKKYLKYKNKYMLLKHST